MDRVGKSIVDHADLISRKLLGGGASCSQCNHLLIHDLRLESSCEDLRPGGLVRGLAEGGSKRPARLG